MKLKDAFNDFLAYLKNKGLDEKTINGHKRFLDGTLSHSISEKKLKDLTLADGALVEAIGRNHGVYGSQRAITTLRCLLRYLHERGETLPFDWRDLKVPKVPQKAVEYLTNEELTQIRDLFGTNKSADLRTRALIEVLIDTGTRISEAISLNKDDIDWKKKEATVYNSKTKEIGKVYFTSRSLSWLRKYLKARKDNLPCLFVSGRGRLLSVSARNYLRTHTKCLHFNKHIRHHIFRRTLATILIQHKVDIKSVQTIMRHKSERTTLRYYVGADQERAKRLHARVMGKK